MIWTALRQAVQCSGQRRARLNYVPDSAASSRAMFRTTSSQTALHTAKQCFGCRTNVSVTKNLKKMISGKEKKHFRAILNAQASGPCWMNDLRRRILRHDVIPQLSGPNLEFIVPISPIPPPSTLKRVRIVGWWGHVGMSVQFHALIENNNNNNIERKPDPLLPPPTKSFCLSLAG